MQPLPSVHAHGTNGQSYPGRILCVHELRPVFCEHILLIDDHAC